MPARRATLLALLLAASASHAQDPRARAIQASEPPPKSAREAARVDFTGQWVAVVTEDWRWRMVTPSKGDFASIPMTPEAMKAADAWDPAKDESTGEACKAYGAAAIMRRPGRLRIDWQDENTLRIETDEGTQTRLLRFTGNPSTAGERTWQGYSAARWERPQRAARDAVPFTGERRTIEVVTTQLRPGYLRKNGIPYSEQTVVREYFDVVAEGDGDPWLIVTTIVEDPKYLREPFVTSSNFRKQRDRSGWSPTPCAAR
jgi:hypothetical protein